MDRRRIVDAFKAFCKAPETEQRPALIRLILACSDELRGDYSCAEFFTGSRLQTIILRDALCDFIDKRSKAEDYVARYYSSLEWPEKARKVKQVRERVEIAESMRLSGIDWLWEDGK